MTDREDPRTPTDRTPAQPRRPTYHIHWWPEHAGLGRSNELPGGPPAESFRLLRPALGAAAAIARVAAILSIAIGFVAAASWLAVAPAATRLPNFLLLPGTALGLFLLGISLLLQLDGQPPAPWRQVAKGLAWLVAAASLVLLVGHLVGLFTAWEPLALLPESWRLTAPGLPGIQSALPLGLLGLGLALLDVGRPGRWRPGLTLALAACLPSLMALLGHLYGVARFYRLSAWSNTPAIESVVLLALACGVLAARPRSGVVALMITESPGGMMLRRLIPTLVITPVALGLVVLHAQRAGWLEATTGLALLVSGFILAGFLLLWRNGLTLDRAFLEHEEAEVHRRQLAAMKDADLQKDRFLSVLSHELRTPINAITGFGSVMQDEVVGPLNPDQHRYLGKMLSGAGMLLALVNDLLDLSRMQAGRFSLVPQVMALGEVTAEVVEILEPLASQKRQHLINDVPAALPPFMADPQRVGQVLINLIGNAIKFTPAGGTVRISARLEGDRVHCAVSDTGPGIAADEVPLLFKRFSQLGSQTRAGGTGLGLSISKALVEAHGGTIGVESAPGEGSTFWFTLPFRAVTAQAQSPSGAPG